jgi:dihydropteroate synthase
VITHTRLSPKRKGFPRYADVVQDAAALLRERADEARRRGVSDEQLVFDPGIDLAKTPAESVEVRRRLDELHTLGRPLLVAVSRKDFVGAHRAPAAQASRGHARGARRGRRPRRRDPAGARRRGGGRLPASEPR